MKKGSATVEYAIILPIVFAVVITVILVFLAIYQKSLIQSLADATCEGLSMVWGHNPLDSEDIQTGSFKKTSYDAREVYWQINPLSRTEKESKAEAYVMKRLTGIGFLKENTSSPAEVDVVFIAGFPYSKVKVSITTTYQVPGARLLRLVGLGELMTLKVSSEATVFDQKDMINNTDYIIQIVKASKLGNILEKIFNPLKEAMNSLIK